MIFRWNTVPLLRYLMSFSAGIVLQIFVPGYFLPTLMVFVAAFLLLSALTLINKLAKPFAMRYWFGVVAFITFMAAGSLITWIHTAKNKPQHFTHYVNGEAFICGMVDEPLTEKSSSYKTTITVKSISENGRFKPAAGTLMIYFEKDTTFKNLKYGDVIYLKTTPRAIPEPQNPSEFNYRRFLYFHQVYMQAYAKKTNVVVAGQNEGNAILAMAYDARASLVQQLKTYIPDKQQYAVAEALTVGYEDDLDQELIQAFASAGALHVLSVSGMHVGLIFASLIMLLQWTDKIRHAQHFKYSVVLMVIWVYALITGMSPSIMRSAVMITIMIFARWFNRHGSLYNALAVSAFVLLIYNPYYITEVGFQLSYAAVFGIVFLHPMINRWYEPGSFIGEQVWMITSVSIAAQTMTFPLGLLYFHQFPNLFIISNLIIIPLSTVVIYGCIFLLAFSWVPYVAAASGKIIWAVIWFINKTVLIVDAWSYSLIEGISISIFETWLIYLILFFVILFLTEKRPVQLQLALGLFGFVLALQLYEAVDLNSQRKLIVYNVKNQSAINFIDGKNNVFKADEALLSDRSKMLFHVVHNWWDLGVNDAVQRIAYTDVMLKRNERNCVIENGIVRFYNKNILLVDTMFQFADLKSFEFDYVIVSHNALQVLLKIKQLKTKMLIIDSSNSNKSIGAIQAWCRRHGQQFYVVSRQGAFNETINS